jgi:hypothetical protein
LPEEAVPELAVGQKRNGGSRCRVQPAKSKPEPQYPPLHAGPEDHQGVLSSQVPTSAASSPPLSRTPLNEFEHKGNRRSVTPGTRRARRSAWHRLLLCSVKKTVYNQGHRAFAEHGRYGRLLPHCEPGEESYAKGEPTERPWTRAAMVVGDVRSVFVAVWTEGLATASGTAPHACGAGNVS